jgi:DNA-binding transcriptional MerR regulator
MALRDPTLRHYEQVGLVGPIERDEDSVLGQYRAGDLRALAALACLRAVDASIGAVHSLPGQDGRSAYAGGRLTTRDGDRNDIAADLEPIERVKDMGGPLEVLR